MIWQRGKIHHYIFSMGRICTLHYSKELTAPSWSGEWAKYLIYKTKLKKGMPRK